MLAATMPRSRYFWIEHRTMNNGHKICVHAGANIFAYLDGYVGKTSDGWRNAHTLSSPCPLPFAISISIPIPLIFAGIFPCFGSALLRSVDGPPMALDSLTFPQLVNSHVCNYARSSPNFFHPLTGVAHSSTSPRPSAFYNFRCFSSVIWRKLRAPSACSSLSSLWPPVHT